MSKKSKHPPIKQSISAPDHVNLLQIDTVVSLAIVVQNDMDIIEPALDEILAILRQHYHYYELVLVDNGSTDATVDMVIDIQRRHPHIRLLALTRTYELEVAFSAALEHSIGDYVLLMDIKYDPPALIPAFIDQAVHGSDVVVAVRQDMRHSPWYQRPLIRLFYWMNGLILGYPFSPNASYYRLFSRRAVNSITKIRNKQRYLKYFNAMVGFKQATIPYERINRKPHLPTHEPLWRQLYLGIDIILSNSSRPLRLAALVGFLASLLNVVFLIYVFAVAISNNRVAPGWISSSVMSATMFFLLFLILALMSEYIARIMNETKDQPLYFIAQEYVSSAPVDLSDSRNVNID